MRDDGDVFTADFEQCSIYHFDNDLCFKNKIDFPRIIKKIHVLRAIFATQDHLLLCVRGERQVLISNYQGKIVREVNCKNLTG